MIEDLIKQLRDSPSPTDWRVADEIEIVFSTQGWREMAFSLARKTRESERRTIDAVNEECNRIVSFLQEFDPILAHAIKTKEYLK